MQKTDMWSLLADEVISAKNADMWSLFAGKEGAPERRDPLRGRARGLLARLFG